jgi:hypothetical protein
LVVEQDESWVRGRVVKYAAAGYRRKDIAYIMGLTMEQLRRHLVCLGIVEEYPSRRARRVVGRRLAHQGPEKFEEAEYE